MRPLCQVDGCERENHARGLCGSHYQQLRRGDPVGELEPRPDTLGWLKSHASYDGDECLTWPFCTLATGYGSVKMGGRSIGAHRAMTILAHGSPPSPDHKAAHSCGNGHKGCVNPNHLRWATQKENIADMVEHGTRLRGNQLPWAKLTPDDVRHIRATHKRRASPVPLMTKYNITRQTFYDVINRVSWRHL